MKTTLGNYYLTVSLGEIIIDTEKYIAISPVSPMGMLLMGKKNGDEIQFRGRLITVKEVN